MPTPRASAGDVAIAEDRDIQLYRARLFGNRKEGMQYPWESPIADPAAAEKLIHDCGYHRRDEELADAKAVILGR